MNRRIVEGVEVAHISVMSYVRSCKHCDKLLRAVQKGRRPFPFAKQRLRNTIRRGKHMSTSELVSK